MKTRYVLITKINGNYSHYNFGAEDEAEKEYKLKRWKDEHVQPYNQIEFLFLGTDEEHQSRLPKRGFYPEPVIIRKRFRIYARLMDFFKGGVKKIYKHMQPFKR